MERDYNNEDFEFFLKQKTDQYKLYPSDKVWKGIYQHLHPKRKWFTIGGSLLLLTGLIFVGQHMFSGTAIKGRPEAEVVIASVFPTQTRSQLPDAVSNNAPIDQKHSIVRKSYLKPYPPPAGPEDYRNNETAATSDVLLPSAVKPAKKERDINTALSVTNAAMYASTEPIAIETRPAKKIRDISPAEINWLEELAAIKLTPRKKNLFDLQFYLSPTITYRRLTDNKNGFHSNQQNIPLASSTVDIDRYVDHKPSFGAELGSNVLFNASRNLILKTGVQLNYSRYSIKAYKFYFEKASIALNTAGPIADTIRAFTSIRNFNGYSPEELQNQYLQVSVPIGAELKLLGNKRLQLNVAGTVQPNYLLFNDTYLLSTDYVNYAKEASLVRKWNVHTSLEAFLSYRIGGLRWQVGPQFRYQLMSSYIDRYPIKEYLMEYGVKIGVSKTLR